MKLKDKRVLSIRIIKSSRLPETLHHSVYTTAKSWNCKNGRDFLIKYRHHKELKGDVVMLNLLDGHEDNVVMFINRKFQATD